MTEDQIKHMVNRFLAWKLPETFCPDAGISFTPEFNVEYMAKQGKPPMRHEPIGTNLFDATQAEQMVRHMTEGLPPAMTKTDLLALADKIEKLAKAATPGPWDMDSEYDDDALYSGGGGCGRGFKNFFVGAEIGGSWQTLLDTVNSDHKLIEKEYDEDGKNSWDSIGYANAALIVELVNSVGPIIAALRARAEECE